MKRALLAACAVAFPLCSSGAQNDREQLARAVFSNLSDEAVTCGSFFTVVSQCLANTSTEQAQHMSRHFDGLADGAYLRALAYAQVAGMSEEAPVAAARLASRHMWGRIDNNCANIAVLNEAYVDACQPVMGDVDERVSYWMQRLAPQFRPR